jgi:hypothetical protein
VENPMVSCTRELRYGQWGGYLYFYVATYKDGTRRPIRNGRRCYVEVAQFAATFDSEDYRILIEDFRFSTKDGGTPERHPVMHSRPLAVVPIEQYGENGQS